MTTMDGLLMTSGGVTPEETCDQCVGGELRSMCVLHARRLPWMNNRAVTVAATDVEVSLRYLSSCCDHVTEGREQ